MVDWPAGIAGRGSVPAGARAVCDGVNLEGLAVDGIAPYDHAKDLLPDPR